MGDIRDDEHVWRDVNFTRQVRHLKGKRFNSETKAVFGERQAPKQKISTNLYDRVTLEYATSEGDRRVENVPGSNGIQGWWVMRVEEASQLRRRVEKTPADGNPYHADIILPDGEWDTWEDAEMHLRDLLAIGRWQDRAATCHAL